MGAGDDTTDPQKILGFLQSKRSFIYAFLVFRSFIFEIFDIFVIILYIILWKPLIESDVLLRII